MPDPSTPEEWLSLVEQHEKAAKLMLARRGLGSQAHFHSGLAVECALKAYIMKTQRFNSWPSRANRPDLYTHDLRELLAIAAIEVDVNSPIAPAWNVVMLWDRNHGYDPRPMPTRVARGWIDAAFGREGAVTWLLTRLT